MIIKPETYKTAPALAQNLTYVEIDTNTMPALTGNFGVYPRHAQLVYLVNPSSGKDKFFLGYFTTPDELPEEGKPGNYAIVGSTDTIWIWDTDNNIWVDSDTKGQVSTVNDLTGDVKIIAGEGIEVAEESNKIKISSTGPTDVVSSLNELIGDVEIVADTGITITKEDNQIKIKNNLVVTSTVKVNVMPTSSQTATAIPNALAKAGRIIVTPSLVNTGAVYISDTNTYSPINPIYPDPTNNIYTFANIQNVRVFVDNIDDSVDLTIEYLG